MKRPQSLAGLIRERLSQYETRLSVGVHHWVIVDELVKEGYKISVPHFRNLLSLARKKARAQTVSDKLITTPVKQNDAPNNGAIEPTKELPKKTSLEFSGTLSKDDLI